MRIIRAEEMGMCFGVRDALQITDQIIEPSQVTIHGELVHNPRVIHQLDAAGFVQSSETERAAVPETPAVLITAHGVSDRERRRLNSIGKQLIDTTCPLVRRAHDAAMQLAAEGRHVVLVGKPGHVEVQGIVEDLESYHVVPDIKTVKKYESEFLGIVCQTTMPSCLLEEIREEITTQNHEADIKFVDTVCHPTKRRQTAMLDLVKRVDAVVVVGGRNSNNTRRLAELCHQHGVPALHVTCAEEVNEQWFAGFDVVGLTAGTSTLDSTIDAVQERLEKLACSDMAANCSAHPPMPVVGQQFQSECSEN
ncbi:MAG: 4-hydroxy-3-methylbut-2-enyl diphosphate reductase [Rhodopirellula sp.]|nr:4-hydroxy-3-methylbut-2-enyl diphosphate reductase [Rhodopirellula sp.]